MGQAENGGKRVKIKRMLPTKAMVCAAAGITGANFDAIAKSIGLPHQPEGELPEQVWRDTVKFLCERVTLLEDALGLTE